MSSGALLALAVFASGVVSLLIWLVFMLDNPRLAPILRKSVVFFVLPGALLVVIPVVAPMTLLVPFLWAGPLGVVLFLLLLILIEEFLKLSASRSEQRPIDKFAIAMLFGIGELMLAKPLGPLLAGDLIGGWSRWGLLGLMGGGALAMMMHSVTAALYAFRFQASPSLGIMTCFVLHAVYNFLVTAFPGPGLAIVLAVVFAAFLIALWPGVEGKADAAPV